MKEAERRLLIHRGVDTTVRAKMIHSGFRGNPAADVSALVDTLVKVSHLGAQLEGSLTELDINPLMVLPAGQGVKAADAVAVFRA